MADEDESMDLSPEELEALDKLELPFTEGDDEEYLLGSIVELTPQEREPEICLIIAELSKRIRQMRKQIEELKESNRKSQEKTLDNRSSLQGLQDLQRTIAEVVAKEVKKAIAEERKEAAAKAKTAAPTWAAVAQGQGSAPGTSPLSAPTKVIPARLGREMLIKGGGMPADLARRTPQEMVQGINAVSEKKGAVAARRLPSGDVVVTFQDTKTKEWHATRKEWIPKAFGEQAKESCRTFTVLVKGLLKRELQGVTEEQLGQELGLKSVDRVRIRIPAAQGLTRATALVTLTSQDEAKKICDEGVIWRAQLMVCEPYWGALRPTQCYKCWQWGHTQRFCKKEALCPRCGTGAHGEGGRAGEAQCLTHKGVAFHCPACGGRHPAWIQSCPKAVQARARARESYQYRPRTFEAAAKPPLKDFTFAARVAAEEEEFQEVSRKRLRGRPSSIAEAQLRAKLDPRQAKLTAAFGARVVSTLAGPSAAAELLTGRPSPAGAGSSQGPEVTGG